MSFDPQTVWPTARLDAAGLPRAFGDPEAEKAALEDGRAVRWQSRGDVLRITGHDTLDLLHRIAASEVRDLAGGVARDILFTNDKGRVVDMPLLAGADDGALALCGRDQGAPLKKWLERYIITEDVMVERLEDAHVLTLVASNDDVEIGADVVRAGSRVAALDTPALIEWIGANSDRILVGEDAYRAWWIQQAQLTAGPELSSGVNPLEAGWRDRVAWTKGCYIGQEVVARLDTYEKVRRHVAATQFTEAPTEGESLQEDGKTIGRVLATTPNGEAMVLVDKKYGKDATLQTESGATGTVTRVPAAS